MQEVQEGAGWALRLADGDDLHEALAAFAQRHGIRAAMVVSGIGMVATATLGYWDGAEYRPQQLTVPHELIALHGSIAEADGRPSVHLHAGLAGPDHRLVGGHVIRARVGVLGELYVATFPGRTFDRPIDERFGLRRLDLCPGAAGGAADAPR
jgi:predicted DNA-binding protein with PD1-like motif